jgi:Tfp pilus assembly protein PilF
MENNRTLLEAASGFGLEEIPYVAEIVVAVSALLGYLGTVVFGFISDDSVQIVQNQSLRSWSATWSYFHQDVWVGLLHFLPYYRPMFMLWLRLNYALFGLQPFGWHALSVLLHTVASVLVYRLAFRVIHNRGAACAAGVLFALHPVHIESVAWVSGAPDPLMTCFICAAALCFLRFADGDGYGPLVCSAVFAALALLTKETAVVLPLLLAALLLTREAPARNKAVRWLPLYFLLDAAYLVQRHLVLHIAASRSMTFGEMVLTWPSALLFYIRQLLFPWWIALFHNFGVVRNASQLTFAGPLIGLLLLSILMGWWIRRSPQRRLIVVCLAWILISLLPVILNMFVFPLGEWVHDRYLYLPSVGFCLLLVIAGEELVRVCHLGSRTAGVLAAVLALCYGAVGLANQIQWGSEVLLFTHAVEIAPENPAAILGLGTSYAHRGNLAAGIPLLERAVELEPTFARPHLELANAWYSAGNRQAALRSLLRAMNLDSGIAQEWNLLSELSLESGDKQRALAAAQRAIELEPQGPDSHALLGFAHLALGDHNAAEVDFLSELRLYPGNQQVKTALDSLRTEK